MADNAKVCPSCGAKNKKPFYKRVWFWLVVVLAIIIIAAVAGGGNSSSGGSAQPAGTSQTAVPATAKPDKYEIRSRRLIGAMFAMVLAFTILVFTSVVAVVCIDKKELPSATLAGIIILPTMMVTWYYMGIINRERRDILSAVVGDKINSSVIADVVNALRNRR